jgi:hypothetical protein
MTLSLSLGENYLAPLGKKETLLSSFLIDTLTEKSVPEAEMITTKKSSSGWPDQKTDQSIGKMSKEVYIFETFFLKPIFPFSIQYHILVDGVPVLPIIY